MAGRSRSCWGKPSWRARIKPGQRCVMPSTCTKMRSSRPPRTQNKTVCCSINPDDILCHDGLNQFFNSRAIKCQRFKEVAYAVRSNTPLAPKSQPCRWFVIAQIVRNKAAQPTQPMFWFLTRQSNSKVTAEDNTSLTATQASRLHGIFVKIAALHLRPNCRLLTILRPLKPERLMTARG